MPNLIVCVTLVWLPSSTSVQLTPCVSCCRMFGRFCPPVTCKRSLAIFPDPIAISVRSVLVRFWWWYCGRESRGWIRWNVHTQSGQSGRQFTDPADHKSFETSWWTQLQNHVFIWETVSSGFSDKRKSVYRSSVLPSCFCWIQRNHLCRSQGLLSRRDSFVSC